ncbi:prephenate dehydrogenase [Tunicatimonas pelagia]|uniref:prephenate dehydrogenase n=1 Tax=Tunicatimonas pelagia TaxID=931531 RepID=UPI002666CEBF|nr:prephenate dehydrogenase [Tunicatimonas pelagia]WKN43796.1 prephenate dehydrogenase [Tunicatimonas pelagia]
MNISVIGLGLLGGSTALALKKDLPECRIVGVDTSEQHAAQALTLGIADKILPLQAAVRQAEVVILAVPVNTILGLLPDVLSHIGDRSVVVDLGSTKEQICQVADAHPRRKRFVAAHPIAGTERSGPVAAFTELLLGKQMIICDKEYSDIDALERVEYLFRNKLRMQISYMESAAHDRHIAYVSHLSHISSFALSNAVLEREKDEQSIFEMAGSGFSSTVRLAKSNPAMWAPIFMQNAQNVHQSLSAYIDQLQQFKTWLEQQDEAEMYQWMENANAIRAILSGIQTSEQNKT